jgi:SP family myo-inositol transporter-like MFS transporter 13
VISATLVSINSSLGHPLTTLDKSLITSATALFALLVSPVSGVIADRLGRKRIVLMADIAFILGAVVQAVASSVPIMIAGRAIVGLAVGAGSFVAPLYIAELAPAPFRGRLVTLNVLFVTLGQVVAYVVGWAIVQWGDVNTGWRWIVGLGALPAALQALVMLAMPETPRWLVMVGRRDEAKQVLNKVFGAGIDIQRMVDGVLKAIETEVREEEEAKRGRIRGQKSKGTNVWFLGFKDTWDELFRIGGNRRALTIACLLQGLQQLCGFVGPSSNLRYCRRLIKLPEFTDVLLGDYFYHPRFREPNIDLSLGSHDKLFHDLRGLGPNRPRWKKTHTPMVDSYHGNWASTLWRWVSFYHNPGRSPLGEPSTF